MKIVSYYTWLVGIFNSWNAFESINFLSRSHECGIKLLNFMSSRAVIS